MPFAYCGAKHGLASKYPRPRHRTIIEPFAGSAAYSVHHAARVDRVILYDADPAVVDLWHRVLAMTDDDLDTISRSVQDDTHTTDPMIAAIGGSTSLNATLAGKPSAITPRRTDWPAYVEQRIRRTLPHLHKFEIRHGDYSDSPDEPATYFVDPPYSHNPSLYDRDRANQSGRGYLYGTDAIDYPELGRWRQTRPDGSLVIVCEQSPAAWLPFHAIARQSNGVAGSDTWTEVVWRSDLEVPTLFD